MPRIGLALLVSILIATSLSAQNNRSAVSLTGNDAATCTVPDPCRTFDVAISKTNTGGEVIVLSSAGYGPFTVTKSISIISPPAYHAALAPTSGDAITVNVDGATIVLRGLTLNGSLGGVNGITYATAGIGGGTTLYVENCAVSGFSGKGLNFAQKGTLFVSELIARGNNTGIFVDSPVFMGVRSNASVDHALLENNSFSGLEVVNAKVAITDSVIAGNYYGLYEVPSAGSVADLSADNCRAVNNAYGFYSGGGSGTSRLMVSNSVASSNFNYGIYASNNSSVRASNNTITGNAYGMAQNGSAVFESRGNNTVRGNTTAETIGTISTFGPV